jgi:hypothetical protein
MAKSKKTMVKKIGGPFVASAILCQSISEDSDGLVSAHRILDEIRVVLNANAPAEFPSKAHPVELPLFALIMIRRGDAGSGKHRLRLVFERPDGKTTDVYNEDIEMPKFPNGAATVKAKITAKLQSEGVFWIDVILNKERLTRMALNLVIQRAEPLTA